MNYSFWDGSGLINANIFFAGPTLFDQDFLDSFEATRLANGEGSELTQVDGCRSVNGKILINRQFVNVV